MQTPARGSKLTLSVGLVNVPVRLAPMARSDSRTKGRLLCPTHMEPVKSAGWMCEEGHPLDRDETVTGYDGGHGFVVVDRAEAAFERTGTVELERTVDLGEIDPLYFEKPYLLWPDKGGESGHDLIAAALRKSGRALLGTTVLGKSTRQLAIVFSEQTGTLVAYALTYDDALRWSDVKLVADGIGSRGTPAKAQVALAEQLLDSLAAEFDPAAVVDEYEVNLQAAIAAASAGKPLKPVKEKAAAPVLDLTAALMASVKPAAKKKTPAKKKAAAKKAA